MDERILLTWAMGGPVSLPAEPKYDEQKLLQATLQHKLTGRMLGQIMTLRPNWVNPSFVDGLREQQCRVNEGFERRLEELRSICAAHDDLPIAVLKGPTVSLVTRDLNMIRFSNDIDLLAHDPSLLAETLYEQGYSGSDDFCGSHEYASLYREGLNVDIHRYLPIVTSPNVPNLRALMPAANPKIWHRMEAMPEAQITYKDLVDHGLTAELAPGLIFANATLASIITCAHMFRKYCHAAAPLPFATIRLGELCEIVELLRHPSFDRVLFDILTTSLSAEMSVRFVDHLLEETLGVRILPIEFGDHVYPCDLWPPGFAIADTRAEGVGKLIMRDSEVDAAAYIEALGTCDVMTSNSHDVVKYASVAMSGARPIERMMVHGDIIPFSFVVRWLDVALELVVTLYSPPSGTEVFLISLGDILYEVAYEGGEGAPHTRRRRNATLPKTAAGSPKWKVVIPASVTHFDGGHSMRLVLDWDKVPQAFSSANSLTMLLGIRRELGTSSREVTSGSLMPIRIVRAW